MIPGLEDEKTGFCHTTLRCVCIDRLCNSAGRTQSGGNLDVDTVQVSGSTPELEEDDTDLSDVLKRSLEEH